MRRGERGVFVQVWRGFLDAEYVIVLGVRRVEKGDENVVTAVGVEGEES